MLAVFIDTQNEPFQKVHTEGDVLVFARGLLLFYLAAGDDSPLFSQFSTARIQGWWGISDAMFQYDLDMIDRMTKGLLTHHIGNPTLNKQRFRKLNPVI